MRRALGGRYSGPDLLAHVRLTDAGRREAEHHLAMGEGVADAILDTAAALSSMLHALERAVRTLARSGSTS